MQKTYIVASMIAISTILFASAIASVRAYGTYTTTFNINYDPFGVGWTEIHGMNPVYGESIYSDVGSGNTGKVGAGDVRLTPAPDDLGGYFLAGSVVVLGDADVGQTLSTSWGSVRHAESIATDTYYNFGEFIYKTYGTNTTVTVGATRYSNVPGYKVGSIVAEGDSDLGTLLTTFKPAVALHLEKFVNKPLGGTSGYDFARLLVDIFWTADIVDNTPDGMRGYQIHMSVNSTVLTPYSAVGATMGYVLFDFVGSYYGGLTTSIVQSIGPNYIEMSEQILGTVATGAGDASSGYVGAGTEKLVTLVFIPQSETDGSALTFSSFPGSGDYQDAGTEAWHAVNSYGNSSYNVVEVPEFPLGIGVLMSMVALIPVVYVWRTRKKVIKP